MAQDGYDLALSRTSSTSSTGSNTNRLGGGRSEHGRSRSCSRRQPQLSPAPSSAHRRRMLARSMHKSRMQNSSAPPSLAAAAPHTPPPPVARGGDALQAVPGYGWEAWAKAAGCGDIRLPATKRASYAGTTHSERQPGPRSAGCLTSPLCRRSSMDSMRGRGGNGPVSEPPVCHKLVRISAPASDLSLGQHYGNHECSDSDDDALRSRWLAGRVPPPASDFLRHLGVRQQRDVPDVSACGHAHGYNSDTNGDATAPRAQIDTARRSPLPHSPDSRGLTGSRGAAASAETPAASERVAAATFAGRHVSSMPLVCIGPTPHFEALVRAAHYSAQRSSCSRAAQGTHRISSRVARFTRRLVSGLLFGPRHGTSTPPTPSDAYDLHTMDAARPPLHLATGAVATFVSGGALPSTGPSVGETDVRAPSSPHPATAVPGAPATETPAAGGAEGCLRHGGAARRTGIKPPTSRIATRRNVNLTIPTARAPLFLPTMLAMPALSPACTSLNSEVVTATATACSSVLASPAAHSASVDAKMGFALDMPPPLSSPLDRQPFPTAPAGHVSAHGMLCRLAGTRCNSPRTAGLGMPGSPPPAPLHADLREEWGLFVAACLRDVDRRLVPGSESRSMAETLHGFSGHSMSLAESASTAIVPQQPQQQQQQKQQCLGGGTLPRHWFDALDSRGCARLHELAARGVPAGLRRQVWMECAGALDMSVSAVDCIPRQEDIELDLPRTAAIHEPPACHDAGVAELRHVLYGYAAANPDTGYCQGMNKIAHGLLAAGLDAADALAMMRVMLDGGVLPQGMFRPPMAGLQVDQLVLEELVARWLPRLAEHLHVTLGGAAPLAPVTVSWFLTLFVDCLPEPHRLRVWDMLFVHGYVAVFQACLGILATCEDALLRCATPAAVYMVLQNVHGAMAHCDPDEYAARAFGPAAPAVTMAAIEELQSKQRQRQQAWAPSR
ncbi:hypothetical protein H4R19_002269 [Coemansia spiralis]|nr:hypothetical protein H4R19_002269 [Coemansia spiralis]